MADEQLEFPIEEIPDVDSVFMRAHRDHFRGGNLRPGVFRARDGGMSVDWNKYATPEDTRLRAKKPMDNAVIDMTAGKIRAHAALAVNHTPQTSNQAHSDVILPANDEDLTEARIKLGRISTIAIPLEN